MFALFWTRCFWALWLILCFDTNGLSFIPLVFVCHRTMLNVSCQIKLAIWIAEIRGWFFFVKFVYFYRKTTRYFKIYPILGFWLSSWKLKRWPPWHCFVFVRASENIKYSVIHSYIYISIQTFWASALVSPVPPVHVFIALSHSCRNLSPVDVSFSSCLHM